MIVYFTGTGNSRYCAQFLAQQLQEEFGMSPPSSETAWQANGPRNGPGSLWRPHTAGSCLRSLWTGFGTAGFPAAGKPTSS